MSNLFAIAYPDLATAQAVRNEAIGLQKQRLIELEDAVVVERREDGKIKLHQQVNTTGAGAASGALWGGVIGLLFFMPFLGAAVGGAAGAAVGASTDIGVDDNFMREVGQHLQPGGAAVFLLVRRATADKVVPALARYGGRIIQTSLSAEAEAELKATVEAARTHAQAAPQAQTPNGTPSQPQSPPPNATSNGTPTPAPAPSETRSA